MDTDWHREAGEPREVHGRMEAQNAQKSQPLINAHQR
jgi:hypothetical protein